MDAYELAEWEAFWEIEGGWGDYKQDYRLGQLGCILANANRDRKKRPTPFNVEDFTMRPRHMGKPKTDKTAEIMARLDALASIGRRKKGRVKNG